MCKNKPFMTKTFYYLYSLQQMLDLYYENFIFLQYFWTKIEQQKY